MPDGWIWPAYAALDGDLRSLHGRPFHAGDVGSLARGRRLVRQSSPGGALRPRPDQHHAHLYLAIGPSGAAFSLDRWLAQRRSGSPAPAAPSAGANLAMRLIQVHMCVIYFFAGISKLQGPSWWNGEAMWRAFANLEYQSLDMTWLAWHPWLVNAMSHVSVMWEISFCVLIWKKRWRPLVLALAVVLHVGIGACLGMWTFGLIMLVGCAAFLPNDLFQHATVHPLRPRQRAADSREKVLTKSQ